MLIYGDGMIQSLTGVQPDITSFVFGSVYQVWNGTAGNINAVPGQSVMFNQDDKICRLIFENFPYTLIDEAKLVLTENYTPPP